MTPMSYPDSIRTQVTTDSESSLEVTGSDPKNTLIQAKNRESASFLHFILFFLNKTACGKL